MIGRIEACESGHAERLLPMIEAVLAEAGLAFTAVTRIAVTLGPGGFTGLRVGISAARAFALALGVPVVGLTSLHVAALVAAPHIGASGLPANKRIGRFIVAAPAGRGALYAQIFEATSALPVDPPRLIWPHDELSDLAELVAVGPGADLLQGRASGLIALAEFVNLQPDAAMLASCAPHLTPITDVRPMYLRAADAKPQISKALARADDSRHS